MLDTESWGSTVLWLDTGAFVKVSGEGETMMRRNNVPRHAASLPERKPFDVKPVLAVGLTAATVLAPQAAMADETAPSNGASVMPTEASSTPTDPVKTAQAGVTAAKSKQEAAQAEVIAKQAEADKADAAVMQAKQSVKNAIASNPAVHEAQEGVTASESSQSDARQNLQAAQNVQASAQTDVDAAKSTDNTAQSEVRQVQTDQNNAQQSVDQTSAAAAGDDMAKLNQDVQAAQSEATASAGAQTAANTENSSAQSDLKTAEKNLQVVKQAAEDSSDSAKVAAAEQAAKNAAIAVKAAQQKADEEANAAQAAKDDLAVKQLAADKATQAANTANQTLAAKQKAKNAADAKLAQLQNAKDSSDKDIAAATAKADEAAKAADDAKTNLAQKQDDAQQAKADAADATARYNAAVTAQQQAAKDADYLTSAEGQSVAGFFKSRNADIAYRILTDSSVSEYLKEHVHFDRKGDATNLDLVMKSLDYIDEVNALREKDGLPDLEIDDVAMAVAIKRTDDNEYLVSNGQAISHDGIYAYNLGENLDSHGRPTVDWNDQGQVYGFTDPVEDWLQEKQLWDAALEASPSEKSILEQYKHHANWIYENAPLLYQFTGHYLNMVDAENVRIGLGIATVSYTHLTLPTILLV